MREGVTIHRRATPGSAAVIGERCLLMASAHVARSRHVGDDVTLVNDSVLAGHKTVGPRAFISGYLASR